MSVGIQAKRETSYGFRMTSNRRTPAPGRRSLILGHYSGPEQARKGSIR